MANIQPQHRGCQVIDRLLFFRGAILFSLGFKSPAQAIYTLFTQRLVSCHGDPEIRNIFPKTGKRF